MLYYPDEIRTAELEPLESVAVSDDELQMAFTLIEMLEKPFAPEEYHDEYREALMQLIEAKLAGQELAAAEEPETAKVVDLMAALKASVEAAGKQKAAAAGGDGNAERATG
jgi:DNA end-binding protein Ku